MATQMLVVGIGGFLGAIARFGVSQLVRGFYSAGTFPLATLGVNVAGCFLAGVALEVFRDHRFFQTLMLFVGVGFLGAFTTFSAFSVETIGLLREQHLRLAVLNVVANVVLCVVAAFAGVSLGK